MSIDRKSKSYKIICPECKKERFVAYAQKCNIKTGECSGRCKKCHPNLNTSGLSKGWGWNKGLLGYNKGHPAYSNGLHFLGKKHKPESIEKMRLAKLGKKRFPHTEETKEKIRKSNLGKIAPSGENHWNWKGGITPIGRKQRLVFRGKYQKLIFKRDDYTCKLCGSRGGHLQIDHIKNWADNDGLRFDITNCRTLCMKCHYEVTFHKKMPVAIKAWGHNLKKVEV